MQAMRILIGFGISLLLLGYTFIPFGAVKPTKVRGSIYIEESFSAGDLTLDTSAEAISKCHLPKNKYQRQYPMCSWSEDLKIAYLMIPKSGSSSGRHIMKHHFNAKDKTSCRPYMGGDESILTITSVRNPLSRFFASYDEMFVRVLASQHRIPTKYRSFFKPFEGRNYSTVEPMFNTKGGVDILTNAFETFVDGYDGETVFDQHLSPQMPFLWDNRNERPFPVQWAFQTKSIAPVFEEIALKLGLDPPKRIDARSYPRRFNITALKDETIQKICKLTSIDYCCLNIQAPPQCDIKCKWIDIDGTPKITSVD